MTPKPNTKLDIIHEARKLFAKKGFDGTSMNDISEKVGIEKASLYYFFKNKEELFGAVAEHNWAILADELRNNLGLSEKNISKKSFTEYIIKIIKKNVEAGLAVLNFNMCVAASPKSCLPALKHQEYMFRRLKKFFQNRKIKNIPLAETLLVNAIQGYVIQSQLKKPMVTPEAYGQYLVDLLLQ